ncbi:MAG: sugar ABC transporter ATP-binding protein [Lachnospiraceae bacterium]|nr:sugar ABC transporter ATP-binding protein [Lachnospiraceae bacterium]
MAEKLLKMTNICKSFGTNKVLDGIEIEVDKGEVVALLGENGAGKSTLIKILGGIYHADQGEIYIDGELKTINSVSDAGDNGIRIIHQEIVLVPDRSIAANVFLGREYKKNGLIDSKRMQRETQALIDELGIPLRANTLVRELPLGMQQIVEIIKAISAEAKIVVMDEPTSSLSHAETETLFGIIQRLTKKGVGVVYISHRLDELFRITDRILVIRDGISVGNVKTKEARREELVNMMVGRELTSYYTRNAHDVGDIALEVKDFCNEADGISNVNFHVRYGEVVGFAGLVGAKRTETMKTIFGVKKKTSGKLLLDGKEVKINKPSDAIKQGIVYASEDRKQEGLVLMNDIEFNMGLANLDEYIKFLHIDKKAWGEMIKEYKEKFSIKITSSKQIAGDLSGGNQQKVVLSKWLALHPKVIILDEPTRGIDVGSKSEIYEIIDELAANGCAIIIVSSELPEIINMCNRCYVMCEGKVSGELKEADFSQEAIMTMATNRE